MKPTIAERLKEQLKKELENVDYLDVGKGSEEHYAVNREKLLTAVRMLQEEGYHVRHIRYSDTVCKILSKNEIPKDEIFKIWKEVMTKRLKK